jgi:hypothetical protein
VACKRPVYTLILIDILPSCFNLVELVSRLCSYFGGEGGDGDGGHGGASG